MFQDKDCFERFALLIVSIGTLGAAAAGLKYAAEGGQMLAGATSLWARLRGQAQSDAPKVVARLSAALRDEWDTWGKTSSHADDNLRASARVSFEEVIDRLHLDPDALVGQRLDAQAVADLALSRAVAVFPEAYANTDPKSATARLTRKFLHDVTLRAYEFLLNDAEFVNGIAPALWRGVLGQLDRVEADTQLLVKQMEKAIRDLALREGMVIGIARRIAEGVEDFDTAVRELERAIGIAARLERESKLPSNSGDQITRVLAELSRLNDENRLDDGASMVMDAFDRLEAERTRLIEIGLEQDILRRNVEGTAKWVIRQVLAENAVGRFAALREEQQRWYERGRDKGLNFDLEVSVHLARAALHYVSDADERGNGQNDMGAALRTLGERRGGEDLLEQAVTAYRAALMELTWDRVPLDWAETQNNLAIALRILGERRGNEGLLELAITAYRAALTEYRQDRAPLDWAMTQNNLGNALRTLGARQGDEEMLELALTAYRAALTVWTQERVPLDWARTQNNLGIALRILGERRDNTHLLEQAVCCYRSALTEWGQDRVPLNWAGVQNNLGAALQTLGELQCSEALVAQAIDAYDAALTEYTQERVPLDWAMSFGNQGIAKSVLAGMRDDLPLARQALAQVLAAAAAMREGKHVPYADHYADQIPLAQALIDRLSAASP